MLKSRFIQILIVKIFSCIICLIIFLFCYYHYSYVQKNKLIKNYNTHTESKKEFEIKGFRFNAIKEGKNILFISADRFIVQKEKIGYFRFSLLNSVTLENVFIILHENVGKKGMSAEKKFSNIFSDNTPSLFPVKKISSVIMEPVRMELHNEQSLITCISSESAIIQLKNQVIVFKGNVKAESGYRVLTTGFLKFYPDKSIIKTDQYFVIDTPEKQWNGKSLTTDIYLNFLNSQ